MPDFKEFNWGIYKFRLRPNDSLRKAIAKCGLPDFLNYFDASDIKLDLRVSIPKRKDTRDIKDIINYEWLLCTRDDNPVIYTGDERFHFYNTHGNGTLEIETAKSPKTKKHDVMALRRYEDGFRIMLFKLQAVNIGCLSRLEHYKVIMKFTKATGDTSEYTNMAQFTINDKDTRRQNAAFFILGLLATAIFGLVANLILHACGIMS